MKDGKGSLAGIGAIALAVLCCAGLPLIIVGVAAVGAGGVLGGVGVAVFIALIAIATIAVITRRRQHRV